MDISEQIDKTQEILEAEYIKEILLLNKDNNTLIIDFSKLLKWNLEIAENLLDDTWETLSIFRSAIKNIYPEIETIHVNIQIKNYTDKRKQEKINKISLRAKKKKEIALPNNKRNNRDYALDIANELENSEEIFFKPNENKIIEINEYDDKYSKKQITIFEEITTTRLSNIIDQKIISYKEVFTQEKGLIKLTKTPSETLVKYILYNDEFKESLYNINRLLKARTPFLVNKKYFIPTKGYNEEIDAYVSQDTEELTTLTLEKSKKIIKDLFKEFCFKEEIDLTMAIAGFITPSCRGLYKRITCRTPIFLYLGNRERVGKDYLAGMTGIITEGQAISNPAISSTDRNQNNSEELRKKILSSLKNGTRRLHFENNKGKLNNTILEGISTSEFWSDRELGQNKEIILPNEIDFSLSANIGISWTPDFYNRTRTINLFLAQEQPNERQFKTPDLHGFVKKNRGLIQSAINTIITEWYNAGSTPGNTFTSFPEWARVVGGIMNFCKFGDPCITIKEDFVIGGDTETNNFKKLFEIMNKLQENTLTKEHNISQIKATIISEQDEGQDLFAGWDFETRATQVSFGMTFRKFLGREFSNITLKINQENERSNKQTYVFIKRNIEKTPKQSVTKKRYTEISASTKQKTKPKESVSKKRYTEISATTKQKESVPNIGKTPKKSVSKKRYTGSTATTKPKESVSNVSLKPILIVNSNKHSTGYIDTKDTKIHNFKNTKRDLQYEICYLFLNIDELKTDEIIKSIQSKGFIVKEIIEKTLKKLEGIIYERYPGIWRMISK